MVRSCNKENSFYITTAYSKYDKIHWWYSCCWKIVSAFLCNIHHGTFLPWQWKSSWNTKTYHNINPKTRKYYFLYVSCFPKGLKTHCITFISLMPKFLFVHNMKDMRIFEYSSPVFGIYILLQDLKSSIRIYIMLIIIRILQCTYQLQG